MNTKTCSECGITKGLSEFSPHPRAALGVYPKCKKCRAAVSRVYYYQNRERLLAQQKASPLKKERERKRGLRRKYDMSLEAYELMHEAQSGRCMICGCFEKLLHVDHDHTTLVVRGLLCNCAT